MGLYTVIPREALEMGCIFHELFLQDHRIPCLKETKAVISEVCKGTFAATQESQRLILLDLINLLILLCEHIGFILKLFRLCSSL